MPKRDFTLYLHDILESIEKIMEYTKGMTFEEFCDSSLVTDAVVRNFEIIGEAAARVPKEIREAHSSIPWEKMKSMRNIVIHEYFGVEHDILWTTIKKSLPVLEEEISKIIK